MMASETGNQNTSSASSQLRDFDKLKLDLASAIQEALRLASQKFESEDRGKLRELLTKLADDHFVLAVVGQFSRGKSSLMNALMGLDRLPVGIVPITSVVTKVSFGNPERVFIEYSNTSLKGEIPLSALPEYVTEAGNPGNRRGITAAEVQLPSEFLRRGIYFVDTPGMGSAIRANTETTRQFLPNADAVVFVTAFDSPLGGEEIDFLLEVHQHVRKIFLVANKLDLVSLTERDRVLAFVRDRLENEAEMDSPKLFAVSAVEGLRAKLAGSAEAYKASGLEALEQSLVRFLTSEKASEFLLRTCERAVSLIAGMDPPVALREQAAQWEAVVSSLEKVRIQLSGATKASAPSPIRARSPVPEADLMEAVRKPCQVCDGMAERMLKYMARYQYQVFMDGRERKELAAKGGLCPLHTWQYAEIASPQGISAAYPEVLAAMSRKLIRLAESVPPDEVGLKIKQLPAGPDKCPACQEQRGLEQDALDGLLREKQSRDDAGSRYLPVLCLRHLSGIARRAADSEWIAELINFEAAVLERLAENMQRYALKHDALRRGAESGDERVAYHRGLSQLAGDRRLEMRWHVERLI